MAKKVLIITYYWSPSGGAGVQRWLKFAKYLPEFDIEPIILTVNEKYASYPKIDRSFEKEIPKTLKVYKTKSFEPLKLFTKLTGSEMPAGGFSNVDKESVTMKISRFIRGNFFIPDARRGWNKYAYRKAKELIRKYDIDTVITTSPPHSVQLVGLKLKRKFELKWIADLRDPWSELFYNKELMQSGIVKHINKKWERKVIEKCDEALVVCSSNKEIYASKSKKINPDKIHIIHNGFDNDDFENLPDAPDKRFTITYVGTVALSYNIDILFKALQNITAKNEDIPIDLRFVGSVPPGIKQKISDFGLANIVDYKGYLPHSEAVEYMKTSTVSVNVFPEAADYDGVPGKVAEYIASRKPIISIATHEGDAAKIIAETKSGKTFTRSEQAELENYLQELIEIWKAKGSTKLDNNSHVYKISRKYGAEQVAKIIR